MVTYSIANIILKESETLNTTAYKELNPTTTSSVTMEVDLPWLSLQMRPKAVLSFL